LEIAMTSPTVEQKLRAVAAANNMLPSAIDDLVQLHAKDFHLASDGKVREIVSGKSVKKYLKAQYEMRPEMFSAAPPQKVGSNPWKSGDSPEAHAARLHVIRSQGTTVARALAQQAGTDLAGRKLRSA
jgi:hypothetical protein